MITAVFMNGDTLFLDPTCSACGFGVLPAMDQGADALIVSEANGHLIRLPAGAPHPNRKEVSLDIAIERSGKALVKMKVLLNGEFATAMRGKLTHAGSRTQEEIIKELLPDLPGVEIDSVSIEGLDIKSETMRVLIVYRMGSFLDPSKRISSLKSILDPMSIDLPAKRDRKYPFHMTLPFSIHYAAIIMLPDSWVVTSMPERMKKHDSYIDYVFEAANEGKQILIRRKLDWPGKRVEVKEFERLREMLREVESVERSAILLERIDT